MAMNVMRAGWIGGVGLLLLAANGCRTEATSEEPVELGSTTQALDDDLNWYWYWYCASECERTLNFELDICRYRPEDQWCGQWAESQYNMCVTACAYLMENPPEPEPEPSCSGGGPQPPQLPVQPGCDNAFLGWCQNWCDACTAGESRGVCLRNCTADYCSGEGGAGGTGGAGSTGGTGGTGTGGTGGAEPDPSCDTPELMSCYDFCDAQATPAEHGECIHGCHVDYCAGPPLPSCHELNMGICQSGCDWHTDPFACYVPCMIGFCGYA